MKRHAVPWLLTLPALVLAGGLLVLPLVYTAYLSLTDLTLFNWNDFRIQGFQNYFRALAALEAPFWTALGLTLLWTLVNLLLQYPLALGIALLLNLPGLHFRWLYRSIILLPWAMPGYVAILIWRGGIFHQEFGLLNRLLALLGLGPVDWLGSTSLAFVSALVVNLWMALPFLVFVMLSGLQTISQELHEVARLEGAGSWQKLVWVRAPLLQPAVVPALILVTLVSFKQFDIVFVLTRQSGRMTGSGFHTVLTLAYEEAFVTHNYGYSAALSILVLMLILALALGAAGIRRSLGRQGGASR